MGASENNSKESKLETWAIIATVVAVVCALGWYGSSQAASETQNSSTETSSISEEYEYKINEYKEALSEANNIIEDSNNCVDEAFGLLDEGSYDEALSQIDSCRFETVSEPSDI